MLGYTSVSHRILNSFETHQQSSALNVSINSSGAHPPPGNHGAFAHVVSPGGGELANFIAARGLGISIRRGDPRSFDTRACFRLMDEFIGNDEAFVKDWLVRQRLEKPVDVFKGMLSQF